MSEEKKEMLNEYIRANVAPILLEGVSSNVFENNAVILPANISKEELNGHYENMDYVSPKWFLELSEKNLLVIDDISSISLEGQRKFIELLKYRKISTFDLPKNCVIIIITENLKNVSRDIYSLAAHIGD